MNYRQKKKTFFLIMYLCLLSLFAGGFSIVYAALSETLTISGSGTVTAFNWDVRIEKGLSPVATGKHPFYVVDKGWVQASDLIVDDRLSSMETDNV